MRLPGGQDAIVELAKLRDYCLDSTHPRGRHKARVFLSTLGIGRADAEWLRNALLQAARSGDAELGPVDEFGARFTVDVDIERNNKSARVRSAWIVLHGESMPRLTSCFVLLD